MSSPEASPPVAAMSPEAMLDDLCQRNAELTEAITARDNFIAIAAHELRNPMTPMIGQVDLLLRGLQSGRYSPDQIEHRLERIRAVMHQYVRRATTLLDVSRMRSGKFTLAPVDCDFAELVRDIVGGFTEAARYAGVSIGTDIPASLPGVWDRVAVEQITDNLVSNAIKYGDRRPVEVSVEEEGDKVHLRVRDHGPGIPPDDRNRIFDRFERAVSPTVRRSGFGIGLWVVRQLVEAMNGTIAVGDAQGGGSVFGVTLPRHVGTNSHE